MSDSINNSKLQAPDFTVRPNLKEIDVFDVCWFTFHSPIASEPNVSLLGMRSSHWARHVFAPDGRGQVRVAGDE